VALVSLYGGFYLSQIFLYQRVGPMPEPSGVLKIDPDYFYRQIAKNRRQSFARHTV
jgi:hypothetical protein